MAHKTLHAKLQTPEAVQISANRFLDIAEKAGHDIRSPLAVLMMLKSEMHVCLPEQICNVAYSAIQRIANIADDLSLCKFADVSFDALLKCSSNEVVVFIEQLIFEKRVEYRHYPAIQIQMECLPPTQQHHVKVHAGEMKRIISNLINNAVESFSTQSGHVKICFYQTEREAIIEVKDNGEGIDPQFLSQLAHKGKTFGKENGSGLGLYYAREVLESWGGSLEIKSTLGVGTTVRLIMPFTREVVYG